MKFAGRRGPRFFPRFSKDVSSRLNTPSLTASYVALGLAALCVLVWVGIALLGGAWGVPSTSLFLFPPAYAAYHAVADVRLGWGIAAGLVVLGVIWIYPARRLGRRPFDGLFTALLALELFFLFRWLGLLSFATTTPPFEIFPSIEVYSLIPVLLFVLALLVAWMVRPKLGQSYRMSAPTRVTGFLKKRRRFLMLVGGLLMAVAAGTVAVAGMVAFGGEVPGLYRWQSYSFTLSPVVAMSLFVAADFLYLLGRYYWYRLS